MKYIFNCGDTDELYDLKNDPHELKNLVDEESYQEVLQSMRTALADWMKNHNDRVLNQFNHLRMR